MATIADFRSLINAYLDDKALSIGETTKLNPENMELISRGIDAVNETVNPNLPSRPTS